MVTALRAIEGEPADWVREAFPRAGRSLLGSGLPCAVFKPAR